MIEENTTILFNIVYYKTYKKTLKYVTSKCKNTEDINDIVQEIYVEVYSVMVKKGIEYIENIEAFVMKVTKSKIYKHYSLLEKVKEFIPIFFRTKDDKDENINEYEISNYSIEEEIVNRELLEDISEFVYSKSDDVIRIFYMYYYLDLTITDIAKELSISQSNVKNKLYRTVREIRKIYKKDGDIDERKIAIPTIALAIITSLSITGYAAVDIYTYNQAA